MSTQMVLINRLLRATVKPFLHYMSFHPEKIQSRRPLLCKLASILPVPARNRITPFKLGPFTAEWVDTVDQDVEALARVNLYLHGGGYIACSPITHRNVTTRISRYGRCRVLAINYRKAPEYPYPYPIEDAITAYKWLLAQGYKPENITLAGDSAGGNLTLMALLTIRDRGLPLPAGGICMSPWTDLSTSGDSIFTHKGRDPMIPAVRINHAASLYSNGIALDSPLISPVFADLSGLPPLLVHVGGAEVLLSDAVRFVDRARNFGVHAELKVWPGAPHVFQLFAGLVPQSTQSLEEIAQFMLDVSGAHEQAQVDPEPTMGEEALAVVTALSAAV